MIGQTLAHFRITAKLGEGGMGEVYRAEDGKLGREVAIKVLPQAVAADPERLARFEREAKVLAALNHPHIAAIHSFESAGAVHFLVMELAAGETLADRIARGPLPVEEAIPIALQIAEALEAAHEKGIVHRDLKPANVKLTPDGGAKVLDFGLAKALDPGSPAASLPDVTHSPTLAGAPTYLGMILGTAAYMAPEQARGGAVDKRADIWAFGAVLWEMLVGARLFSGETASDTLAAVLRQEMEWGALPTGTPPAIRRLLRRCLERNPKNRLHDIADARIVLEELLRGTREEPAAAVARPRPRFGWQVAAVLAALAAGAAAGWFGAQSGARGTAADPPTFERLTFRLGHFANARFAPDGQTIFLSAAWEGRTREVFQVRPGAGELPVGLVGAELLSVSRSGELALLLPRKQSGGAYIKTGTLAVTPASGGTPRELAEDVTHADWAPDGRSLATIREVGGKGRIEFPLGTVLYESLGLCVWMRVSPAGDAVAFFERTADERWAVVLVERAGARKVLSTGWSDWWNLAWSPDGKEIWFGAARAGLAAVLYAVDLDGALRPLLSAPGTLEIHDAAPGGRGLVARVQNRSHVFGRASQETTEIDLSWLESSQAADLSRDGRHLLLTEESEREQGGVGVYLRSMDGAPAVRLGDGLPQELSPDGKWALATRGDRIVALPTGAGEPRILEARFPAISAARWLPDGERVLVAAKEPGGRTELSVLGFDGEAPRSIGATLDLRRGLINNRQPLAPVSPDGRLAAAAVESGGILVLPLEGGEPRPLPGSGRNDLPAQWTPDGRQLYVYDPSELPLRVFKVDVASGARELWREIRPSDAAGVYGIAIVLVTPAATAYAYSYHQYLSELYLVEGLR